MMILAICLCFLGVVLGGPLGLAAAIFIIALIAIIKGLSGAMISTRKDKLHAMKHTTCPHCKEEVKIDAVVCKHCKSDLEPDEYKIKARDKATGKGGDLWN